MNIAGGKGNSGSEKQRIARPSVTITVEPQTGMSDSAMILRAAKAVYAAGGGSLEFLPSAGGYAIDRPYESSQRGLSALPNVNWRGNGSRFELNDNCTFIFAGILADRDD